MKNQGGWTEFRKKRFYEKQKRLKEISLLEEWNELENAMTPPTIAVLLDLDGTCDYIDDKKARIFLNQLETLRKKFRASFGTISISTHSSTPDKMKLVLDILARNKPKSITIGTNFYYGGTYDYEEDSIKVLDDNFNADKVETFTNHYLYGMTSNNQWFAIIDDGISPDVYKQYQYNHPMLLCRPSQTEYGVSQNCFMSIATTTDGFDGVIEGLDTYIASIRKLSKVQILEKQRKMITHLASWELQNKIIERDYEFIKRYFKEDYADEEDYKEAIFWIRLTNKNQSPTKEEMIKLREILETIVKKYIRDTESSKETIKKLTKMIDNQQN